MAARGRRLVPRRLMAALTLLTACTMETRPELPAQDLDSLRAELERTELAFAAATAERGVEGWLEYFAADGAQLSSIGRVTRGHDEIRALMTPFFADRSRQLLWRPALVDVSPSGEMGYTWGPYELVQTDSAGVKAVVSRGTFMTVWRREARGWKVLADMGSEAPPAPAP